MKFEGELGKAIKALKINGELHYVFKGNKFEKFLQPWWILNINYNNLKDEENKLLLLFKTTFELKRLQKINEKEEFQNEEDKRLYETTVEYQNMWKNYEINDKFSNYKNNKKSKKKIF